MKNKVTLLIIALLAISLTSCATKGEKIESVTDLKGKVIGVLSNALPTQNQTSNLTILIKGAPADVVAFNRGADMYAALRKGEIDAFPIAQFVAGYLLERNKDFKAIPVVDAVIEAQAVMAVRSDNIQLKASLDSAILILKENGTIAALEEEWITNLPANREPSFTDIPKYEGAPTYNVGVAGDLPPLDYIAANGVPAGFNAALLSEIAKILNINFEFVFVETQERFTALAAKKIDIVFCHFHSTNTSFDELKDDSWVGTHPYFKYQGGSFLVKK